MTQSELAKKYGVSRQAVSAAVKRSGSIAAADEALAHSKTRPVRGPLAMDYEQARTRKIAAEAETAELKLAQTKAEVVEVARVLKATVENVARARSMLDAAFRSELPARQGGLPADQIAEMNAERLDEIYKELSKV